MAYITTQDEKEEEQASTAANSGSNTTQLNNSSGILGSGVSSAPTAKSEAGAPGSWTNIQEYLGANPNAGDSLAEGVKNTAAEKVSGLKTGLETATSSLPTISTPTAYNQSSLSNYLTSGTGLSDIESGLNQSYTPQDADTLYNDYTGQYQSAQEEAEKVKPGDFTSISDYLGDSLRQSTNYTPGQQNLDQLFLRNVPGFANEFPTQYQADIKGVGTDLESAKTARTAQETAAQTAAANAKSAWKTGLTDYLGGVQSNVQSELEKEQSGANMPDYASLLGADNMTAAQQYGLDPSNYAELTGYVAPDINTAALSVLGSEGIGRYGDLATLGGAQTAYYQPAAAYNPGTYNFNQSKFTTDLTAAQQAAAAKAAQEAAAREAAAKAAQPTAPVQDVGVGNISPISSSGGIGGMGSQGVILPPNNDPNSKEYKNWLAVQ